MELACLSIEHTVRNGENICDRLFLFSHYVLKKKKISKYFSVNALSPFFREQGGLVSSSRQYALIDLAGIGRTFLCCNPLG